MFEQLGLIGCGLIGGSFALALKRAKLVKRVVGYSKSPSTTERARQLGVIDVAAPSALLAVSGADIVLLAVPVAASEATFKAIRHGIGSDALVMDVGSTKGDVIEAARRGLQGQLGNFVPAHPIAGKEVSGIEHAEASLFTGRHVVLTPIKSTLRSNVQRASQVWSGIGANVLTMTHEEHDSTFAAVSHLPHLLAFAYVNGLAGQPQGERFLSLGGPGLSRLLAHRRERPRDVARRAAGQPRAGAGAVARLPRRAARDGERHGRGRIAGPRTIDRARPPRAGRLGSPAPRRRTIRSRTPDMYASAFLDLPALTGASGTVQLPGSKSISNRVLLLAALASGTTTCTTCSTRTTPASCSMHCARWAAASNPRAPWCASPASTAGKSATPSCCRCSSAMPARRCGR